MKLVIKFQQNITQVSNDAIEIHVPDRTGSLLSKECYEFIEKHFDAREEEMIIGQMAAVLNKHIIMGSVQVSTMPDDIG